MKIHIKSYFTHDADILFEIGLSLINTIGITYGINNNKAWMAIDIIYPAKLFSKPHCSNFSISIPSVKESLML